MTTPSYFGEVMPISSRAVDEDEDEDDADHATTSGLCFVRWSPEARIQIEREGCVACSVLVIAIDAAATGFVQTFFLHGETERIGVVSSGLSDKTVNTLSQNAFTDETCYIYRLKRSPSILFCQCNTKVTPEQSFSWTNELFSNLRKVSIYVAVLSRKSVNEYHSEVASSDLQTPFLRALKTTYFQGVPVSPCLEQPNIIDGLPAQIMMFCQVHSIPAVYYVVYTENMYLDIQTMKEFQRLLNITPFKDVYQVNPSADQQLLKLAEQKNALNTLYM